MFVFLYVLYVYDDSHRHFGVLEKGYDGIKGFDDLGQILRSRIVRDFNENMTWINTVFGSVIGCVTIGLAIPAMSGHVQYRSAAG